VHDPFCPLEAPVSRGRGSRRFICAPAGVRPTALAGANLM
jgi:hypothetical protein